MRLPTPLACVCPTCRSRPTECWPRCSRKKVGMRAFEYASPKAKEQAVRLLGASWGESEILAGGTDLLALMKDDVVLPKRLVNIKDLADLRGIRFTPQNGLR